MSIIDNLIYDRTQSDADRVQALSAKGLLGMTDEEKTEYLAGMKGAYNSSDLNRVAQAVLYLAERLLQHGTLAKVHAKTDWQMQDIPTVEQMSAYLENLRAIRSTIAVLANTPSVPASMEKLSYTSANDMEKMLKDIDTLITKMGYAYRHTGMFYTGQGGLIA